MTNTTTLPETSTALPELHQKLLNEALQRVAADLSVVTDRPLVIQAVECTRASARPAGRGSIHISFKLGVQSAAGIAHGTLLMPYAPAVALAAGMLMLSPEESQERTAQPTLDPTLKDALIEIGNFVASACGAALRTLGRPEVRVVSESCQGVRADTRPALAFVEGSSLTVGRAQARLCGGEPFEIVMMLPPIA